jgi:hypothetical protein
MISLSSGFAHKNPGSRVFQDPCKLCFLLMDTGAWARIDKISAVVIDKKCHGISHRDMT